LRIGITLKIEIRFSFENPSQQDQGIYKVVATNPQGSHSVEQNYMLKCTANEVFKQAKATMDY